MNKLTLFAVLMLALAAVTVSACGDDDDDGGGGGGAAVENASDLSGDIRIDGSSTVFPFAQAAAELFQEQASNVKVTVGQAGTGGGFEKFCAGETDISNASRPIDEEEEVPVCEEEGVAYQEVQVANDGIAVVTNPAIEVDCMTVDQLKQVWDEGSSVKSLSDVEPSFPDQELSLYGPGTDSGTFDFFTDVVNGEEGQSRTDYSPSEDDNVLVQGVSGDDGGFGYFGHSYYEQNKGDLGIVKIDSGDGNCVEPTTETIQDGSYTPLSRPIFMYPSDEALRRPEVKAFMDFVLNNQQEIAELAQIVPMTQEQADEGKQRIGAAQ